jgi:phosphatidate cytidylyltransferase
MKLYLLSDRPFQWLIGGVIALLIVATAVGIVLGHRVKDEKASETIRNLRSRVNAWWGMVAIFCIAILTGGVGSILLFGLLSFLALREFITLVPTARADNGALFWVFFVITPLQYILVGVKSYGLFVVVIPVYGFLFLTIRIVLAGDTKRFLERAASIQWAVMACVYCVSFAPALLNLDIPGFEHQGAKLLMFLVLVVQISDVMQYIFGKLFGFRSIVPSISPNKTWAGFAGGIVVATSIGTALWWATPFRPWQATIIALVISLMGFVGGLVMSAVKRDYEVKDFGTLIAGHGGVLDRIDSIVFAAPVFFAMTILVFPQGSTGGI